MVSSRVGVLLQSLLLPLAHHVEYNLDCLNIISLEVIVQLITCLRTNLFPGQKCNPLCILLSFCNHIVLSYPSIALYSCLKYNNEHVFQLI